MVCTPSHKLLITHYLLRFTVYVLESSIVSIVWVSTLFLLFGSPHPLITLRTSHPLTFLILFVTRSFTTYEVDPLCFGIGIVVSFSHRNECHPHKFSNYSFQDHLIEIELIIGYTIFMGRNFLLEPAVGKKHMGQTWIPFL